MTTQQHPHGLDGACTGVLGRADRLMEQWRRIVAEIAADLDPSDSLMRQEQDAYDALVDFVETHGLNYSAVDPRGPKREDEQ